MDVEDFILIDRVSLHSLKNAEKSGFALQYSVLLDKCKEEETIPDDGDGPQVQSDEDGIEVLNLPQDVYDAFMNLLEQMKGATMQTTSSEKTAELRKIASKRDKVMQWIIRTTLDYDQLPLSSEQTAAEKLAPTVMPYKGFYREPIVQKYAMAEGLLKDLDESPFQDEIEMLGFKPYMEELRSLNAQYGELSVQRSSETAERITSATSLEISEQLEDIINIINAYANATVVLHPNEKAKQFVMEVNNLYRELRIARNMRGSGSDEEDSDGDEGTDKPGEDDLPVVH